MKKFILFLLLSAAITSNAQVTHHFPHTNATWGIFSGVYFSGEPDPVASYYVGDTHFETATGDTIIGGLTYIKICPSDEAGNILSRSQPKLIREDGDKVYTLTPDSAILLYDFSLQPGDTVNLYLFYSTQFQTLKVDSVKTLTVGNQVRRCLFLNYRSSYAVYKTHNLNIPSIDPVMWIEGIGSIDGLLYPYGGADIVDGIEFLTCFKENDTLKYGNVCRVTVNGIDKITKNNAAVRLYPNPSSDLLSVSLNNTGFENCIATVYAMDGKIVSTADIKRKNNYQLNTSGFAPGFYLLTLQNGTENITQKFKVVR